MGKWKIPKSLILPETPTTMTERPCMMEEPVHRRDLVLGFWIPS